MPLSQKDVYTMMFREYPDVVTVSQMSEMLGISEKSAYRLLKENCIECTHFFNSKFYSLGYYHS